MPIIVAGYLKIKNGSREQFIAASIDNVRLARENNHCLDFALSADPIDLNRVNIFE